MVGYRHDATGRSTGRTRDRRQASRTGPPKDEAWAFMSLALLESDAFRSLSINARRVLDRLMIEHFRHNRTENGDLRVAARQFHQWGVTKVCLTPAVHELEGKGLIVCTWGAAKGVMLPPRIYRLTFYSAGDESPSNEWRAWRESAEAAPPSQNIIGVPKSRDGETAPIALKKRPKKAYPSLKVGTGKVIN